MPSKKPEGFKFSKAVLIDKETGLPVAPEDVEQFASEPRELTSLTNQVVRALPRDEVTTPFPIPKTPIPRPRTEQSVFYEQALDDEIADENLREYRVTLCPIPLFFLTVGTLLSFVVNLFLTTATFFHCAVLSKYLIIHSLYQVFYSICTQFCHQSGSTLACTVGLMDQ
jgi:hypothetical protein